MSYRPCHFLLFYFFSLGCSTKESLGREIRCDHFVQGCSNDPDRNGDAHKQCACHNTRIRRKILFSGTDEPTQRRSPKSSTPKFCDARNESDHCCVVRNNDRQTEGYQHGGER
jgi:hypothetical protein